MRRLLYTTLSVSGGGGMLWQSVYGSSFDDNNYNMNNVDEIGLSLRRERAFSMLRYNRRNTLTKSSGLVVLNRVPRHNSKLFEEIGGDDWQQECVDEQCSLEEATEAIKSETPDAGEEEIKKKYSYVHKSCNAFPCSPRGTKECWRYWGWRQCKCYQFGYISKYHDGLAIAVDAFTKSDSYATNSNYPVPSKDDGSCDTPVDVCQYYADKDQNICTAANERCESVVPLKQYHSRLRKAKKPIPKNYEDYGKNFPGYVCSCKTGFERDPESNKCVKIDFCNLEGFCPENSSCKRKSDDTNADEDTPDFRCECNNPLFQLDSTQTACVSKYCEDLPEDHCAKAKENSHCIGDDPDMNPSFEQDGVICSCDTGYVENENGKCIDDDECENPDACSETPNSACKNTVGGFECSCNEGYEQNGDSCSDVDECQSAENVCLEDQACRNTDGGFVCCENKTDVLDEDNKCIALDCTDHDCSADDNSIGIAESTEFGAQCVCECKMGYEKNILGQCENIDECSTENQGCQGENVICKDLDPMFECTCDEGYKLNDDLISCSLADPCATAICENSDETCHSSADKSKAICCKNYQNLEDGDICVDDPAKTCGEYICNDSLMNCEIIKSSCPSNKCGNIGKCGPGRFCLEWDGRYMCQPVIAGIGIPRTAEAFDQCDEGLKLDWETKNCLDIDECQIDNGGCEKYCMNFYAGHHCYEDPSENYKFCHHTHQKLSAEEATMPDFENLKINNNNDICDCFGNIEYGLCEDKYSCVSNNWNSAENTIAQLTRDSVAVCNECQIAFGDKCYQKSNGPARGALANDICSENGGKLATVNSRELWFVLGHSLKNGMEPFLINSFNFERDADSANMVVLGEFHEDAVLITNLESDMNIVPPAFRWASNLLEHSFYCEYPSGNDGHDCNKDDHVEKPNVSTPVEPQETEGEEEEYYEELDNYDGTDNGEPDADDDDDYMLFQPVIMKEAPRKSLDVIDLSENEKSVLDNAPGPNDISSDIIDDAEYDNTVEPLAASSNTSDDYNDGEYDENAYVEEQDEYDEIEDVSNETEAVEV